MRTYNPEDNTKLADSSSIAHTTVDILLNSERMTDYNTHQDSPNCCCPHLLLSVRVGSCCQKKFNHPLVATKACSQQWCATILQ